MHIGFSIKTCLPGVESGNRDLGVERVRRGDEDDVDVLAGDELAVVGGARRDVPAFADDVDDMRAQVRERCDLELAGEEGEAGKVHDLRRLSAAHDSDPEPFHELRHS